MTNDICPFCSAERFNLIEYKCGTPTSPMTHSSKRTSQCYKNQITQLINLHEALVNKLELWREFGKNFEIASEDPHLYYGASRKGDVYRLKEVGEWQLVKQTHEDKTDEL